MKLHGDVFYAPTNLTLPYGKKGPVVNVSASLVDTGTSFTLLGYSDLFKDGTLFRWRADWPPVSIGVSEYLTEDTQTTPQVVNRIVATYDPNDDLWDTLSEEHGLIYLELPPYNSTEDADQVRCDHNSCWETSKCPAPTARNP
eukprot:TRINITY_DN11997_c0_g1_i1.p1 TRINITY_DN11997_c0_g1~~TRINITY_DN11997_c0_g1_i1.p1  ORF type:complete len:143 (+),score=0.95 TRINITY_DN11997_c0_g1_i1:73-501(+)